MKFLLGILFLILGFIYLYRPDLIFRMNALMRAYFFNDATTTLERRKWGLFFLLLSLLCLYLAMPQLKKP